MGSSNKYGNSLMLTDKERNYLVSLIYSVFVDCHSVPTSKILDFSNKCASILYIQYNKRNSFNKVNEVYEKAVTKLAEEIGVSEYKNQVIQQSYIGLSNLLLISKEYNADGATKVGQDNLSVYLNK